MIEKLKDLEQEAMDYIDPEVYESIVSNVMEEGEQWIYQAGYIDGLQTAIRLASENDTSMSYTVELNEIYDDEDENTN